MNIQCMKDLVVMIGINHAQQQKMEEQLKDPNGFLTDAGHTYLRSRVLHLKKLRAVLVNELKGHLG